MERGDVKMCGLTLVRPWFDLFYLRSSFICAGYYPINQVQAITGPSVATTAINALGIDLLQRTGKPDTNALISPYSIQSAMAMAYAGADGATRNEMAKVLHYPEDEAELHRSFAQLRATFARDAQESAEEAEDWKRYGGPNDPLTLSIATRVFAQSGYDFRASFLSLLKDTWEAPLEAMDFVHAAAAATKRINDWVESQTQERIQTIIPEGELSSLTRLVLVNAVYLKAPWARKFDGSLTKPSMFYLNGGQGVEVAMMNRTSGLHYSKGDGFSMVALPYRGYKLWFLIILPDKRDGLADVESKLSAATIDDARWDEYEVTLQMPRLNLEPAPLALGRTFQGLGMKTAFDNPAGSANFDRMAPLRPNDYLLLSEVFHKTFLKLDEDGTEAAAAAAVLSMLRGIEELPKRVEMKVDHPFLFAIRRAESRALLFLGRVVDPLSP